MNFLRQFNQIHSLRTSIVALILVVAVMFLNSSASAQGTQGMLPKPITSREFDGYAKRLVLSDPQKQALEPIHEEYREKFRQLRENDIQDFLDETAKMMEGGTITLPQRESIEKMLRNIKRILGKIKNLDNRYFGQVELLLDESQLTIMPRVRLARERARYRQASMMGTGGFSNSSGVDLSEIYSKLDLSLDEATASHSAVVNYEKQLTSAMKDVSQATMSMTLDMVDAIRELGITSIDTTDPEALAEYSQAMQTIWKDIGNNLTKKTQKISDLNNKTLDKIVALITEKNARDLKYSYYRKAYPMASFDLRGSQMRFELALRYPDLNEQQRQLITDAASDHQNAHDRITEEMVDFLEDFNKNRSMFDAMTDQNIWQEYQEKLSEFHTRRQELNETAKTSLDAQLGEELVAKINDPRSWANSTNAEPAEAPRQTQLNAYLEDSDFEESYISYGGGIIRPPAIPIRKSELSRIAEKLGLNDQQQLIVQELHQQYTEQYQQFAQKQQTEIQKAYKELREKQQSSGFGVAFEYEDISQKQQTEKLDTLGKLDSTFLDDVQLLLDDSAPANALERLRLARKRILYDQEIAGSYRVSFGGDNESNEPHVDLTTVIRNSLTDLLITNEIDSILYEYEKNLTNEFSERYDLEIQEQKRKREIMNELIAKQEDESDASDIAFNMEWTLAMQEINNDVKQSNDEIVKLNRDTIDELLEIVDGSSAKQLRRAYKRASYPVVYQDMNSGERYISAAFKLRDITDNQSMSIKMYELEFQPQYEKLCDKLVDIYEYSISTSAAVYGNPEFWQEYQKRQQKVQVIQFDRNELNAKAKRRLRQILSPVQLERIGLRKAENSPG